MKRIISLLLALVMVFNLTACIRIPARQDAQATEAPAVTAAPKAQATEAPEPEDTAAPSKEPAPDVTAAPEPEATEEPMAPESWADIDRDFFREYLSSDLTSLHQLVKDPAAYGIDYDSVERSLGSYKEDTDREWYAFEEEILRRMDAVDLSALSEQERLSYDTLRQYIEWDLEGEEFYGYYEPLTELTGIQSDIPIVFWFYELNTRQDVEDYLTLLADLPRFFSELLDYERYRAEELHIFMPERSLDNIIENDIDPILAARETSFLIPLFAERVRKVPGLTEAEIQTYEERNTALVTNDYYQAYLNLKEGLEALRPCCRKLQGVKETGDEKYLRWFAYQLKVTCDEETTPQAVADRLFKSVQESIGVYLNAVKQGGDELEVTSVGTVEENIAYLKEVMDPLLPPIPEVEVEYQDMPEELRSGRSTAFYLINAVDQWQLNHIVVADPENLDNLISTLAHEGFNGHLYQYVYHRSMADLGLSRQLLEGTAYAEAWSQYSERLFAFHCGEPFDPADMQVEHAFGILYYALLFYLSVRVNYFGDSFDAAYKTISKYLSVNKAMFRSELYDPYILGNPFYGIPYAYGYARIVELHSNAQKALGAKYDQKTFDTQYLSYGPTYFNLLADRLDGWAREQ